MNAAGSDNDFMPHGMCFLWNPHLLALHVISDALIALAYYSIPLILLFFIRKRSDLPFAPVVSMFGVFIVACGTTHLFDIWTIWHPTYWLSGSLKAVTAVVSLATAVALVRIIPAALALKSPRELAAINRQLSASELRYRTLTDTLPQMIGILDRAATLSYANEQWRSYTGTPVGERDVFQPAKLVHADDAAAAQALLQSTETERERRAELRIRRHDDTYRWHEVRIVALGDAFGAIDQWMFTCTDIEAEHAARTDLEALTTQLVRNAASERATTTRLKEQNRLLTMAEEIAHVGHWRFDLSASALYWSDEVYRTFGLPMTFRPALADAITVYHPDDRHLASACLEKAITAGTPFSFEGRIVRPDGEIRHVVSAAQSEFGADHTVQAIFGVLQDVTENKRAAREQERLIVRYDVATLAARVGIWDWDIVAKAVDWNPVMFELHGFAGTPFEPSYAGWAATIHPEDRARAEQELAQAIAGDGAFDTEFRVVHLSGDVRNMRAMATVMRNEAGAANRIIGTNWDVTETRALAAQLSAENHAATLVASHDALTGLMNELGVAGWSRDQTELAGTVLVLRVDGLSAVNARGGDALGDASLRAVARIIQQEVREADTCARIGGVQFLVVLPNVTGTRTARNVSSRIGSAVDSLRPLGPDDALRIGLSIGIAPLAAGASLWAALREADADLDRRTGEGRLSIV